VVTLKRGDYRSNAELYGRVEDIPGEQAMFVKAAQIIVDYAKRHKALGDTNRGIIILDLCCGAAPILELLPPLNKCPKEDITCVDMY